MYLDANLRPVLNYKGIVSKNTAGEWNILCSDQIDILKNGAQTAGQICSILGFSGYSFFNSTDVIAESLIDKLHDKVDEITHTTLSKRSGLVRRHISSPLIGSHEDTFNELDSNVDRYEEFVGNFKKCIGLYVECVPHSKTNYSAHIHHHHTVDIIPNKKPLIIDIPITPIKPIINKDKIPTVIAHFNQTIHLAEHFLVTKEKEIHWPWAARIYVNGKLVCVGVLLDKYWVLTESSCMKLIK